MFPSRSFRPLALTLALGASSCRSAPAPIPDAPRGAYRGEGVSLLVDPQPGPLRGVGSIGDRSFAFVESRVRHFDIQVLDSSGKQFPARLSFDAYGRVLLELEGEKRSLVASDAESEGTPSGYAGTFACGLPLDVRLMRQDDLVVGRVHVLGFPYTLLGTSSSDGRLSGFLEGPDGPELPVRAQISEDEVVFQIANRPVVRARRER